MLWCFLPLVPDSPSSLYYLLYIRLLIFKDLGVVFVDILLLPVLQIQTDSLSCFSFTTSSNLSVQVYFPDHRVVEDLPHVWVEPGRVVIGRGHQTAEFVTVGHIHEDSLWTYLVLFV